MNTLGRTLISVVILAIFATGCTASPQAKLTGTKWTLILLQADGKVIDHTQANPITLEIGKKGKIGGSAGCNSYFGTMDFKTSGKVNVKEVGSTEMACMKGMDVETAYLNTFRQGGTWSLEGNSNTLTITAPEGESLLVFTQVIQ